MGAVYIEEISPQTKNRIRQAIVKHQEGAYSDLPGAIAAILEMGIKDPAYQEFAVENYSQIVGIIIDKRPKYLAIKRDVKGYIY